MSSSVCVYFRRGSCRFGHRCRNSHDLGSVRSGSQNIVQVESSHYDDDARLAVEVRRESTPMTSSPSTSASRPTQIFPNPANMSSETDETASHDEWILKNNITGEMIKGTPDSVLIEAVKKLSEAENLVISLRQQLRDKNDEDNISH